MFASFSLSPPVVAAEFDAAQFSRSLSGKSFDAQMKLFAQAFQEHPNQPNLDIIFLSWIDPSKTGPWSFGGAIQAFQWNRHETNPAENEIEDETDDETGDEEDIWINENHEWNFNFYFGGAKKFKSFFKGFTPEMHRFEGVLAKGMEHLYQERNHLEGKVNHLFSSTKNRYWDLASLIVEMESLSSHLRPKVQLFLSYLENYGPDEGSSELIKRLFYQESPSTRDNPPSPIPFQSLLHHRYSLAPSSRNRFDRALRQEVIERLESLARGKATEIGPVLFSQLIKDDPELADRYLDLFLESEFFPKVLGAGLAKKAPYDLKNLIETTEPIFHHLLIKPEWKNKVSQIITQIGYGAEKYGIYSTYAYFRLFHLLLPFIDEKTMEGQRFIFRVAPLRELNQNPFYFKCMRHYFLYLADHPREYFAEMNLKQSRIFRYFTQFGSLQKLFPDNSGLQTRFARVTISTLNELRQKLEGTSEEPFSYTEASQVYSKFLMLLAGNPMVMIDEVNEKIDLFQKFITPPNTSWARAEKDKLEKIENEFNEQLLVDYTTVYLSRLTHLQLRNDCNHSLHRFSNLN